MNPIDSSILLTQLAFPNGNTYVINNSRVNITPILPFFEDKDWLVIIQNSKFERKFTKYHFGRDIINVFDTMLAESVLTTQLYGNSLAALAKKYQNRDLDKSIRKNFFGARPIGAFDFSKEELDYAAQDAEILLNIYGLQAAKLREEGLEKVANLEFDVAQVVAEMELAGVPVDIKKWNQTYEEARKKHEEYRIKIHEHLFDGTDLTEQLGMFERDSINLNSPKQVGEALAKLGIEIPATNERELEKVKGQHPVIEEFLNYREYQKIISSYGKSFLDKIHPFTNRIHPDFQQLGTQTGRFSCKEPNFQQVPEDFRECIGDPNYKIIAADYSQIELRILAELSGDPGFIQAFESGQDLHKATASRMFNVAIDKVNKEQRFISKTINFGLAYGMGVNKLKDTLNANSDHIYTLTEARSLINKYKTTFFKAITYLQDSGNLAYRKGYSETMYGRKRFFERPAQGISEAEYDKQVASIKRQGANAPIQGTNADMTKLAMKDINREIKNYYPSTSIIIQVHDEIVLLARKEEAEAVSILVRDSMEESAKEILKKVPVKVEVYVSDYWTKG